MDTRIELPSIPKLPGSEIKKSSGGPKLSVPKLSAPKLSAPKFSAPSISAPTVEVGAGAGQQAAAVAAAEVIALLVASSLVGSLTSGSSAGRKKTTVAQPAKKAVKGTIFNFSPPATKKTVAKPKPAAKPAASKKSGNSEWKGILLPGRVEL